MSLLIFIMLVFFIVAQVYVEAVNEGPDCHWWRESMSHYLGEVKHAGLQGAAYIGLALAELLLLVHASHGVAADLCLYASAAGLFGVTVTGAASGEWDWHPTMQRLHVIFSGFAFGGAFLAEAIYLWHSPAIWLVIGAAVTAIAFKRFAPSAGALEEKLFAAWIVAAFIAIAGVPL